MQRHCRLKKELEKRDAMMDRLRDMVNDRLEKRQKDTQEEIN